MPERKYEVHGSVEVPEGGWINLYERSGDVWFRVTDLERWIVGGETHFVLHHAEKLQTALTVATQQKEEARRAKETAMDFARFEATSSHELLQKLKAVEAERDALRNRAEAAEQRVMNFAGALEHAEAAHDPLRADTARRDEAIVQYGIAVIINRYSNHVEEYHLTRPEYAESVMREVLVEADKMLKRDAARSKESRTSCDSISDATGDSCVLDAGHSGAHQAQPCDGTCDHCECVEWTDGARTADAGADDA